MDILETKKIEMTDEDKKELEALFYSWEFGDTRGSHNYRIWHEKFKEYPEKYGNEGLLTIPTSGGKKIKFFYLRMLCEAVKLIKE